MRVPAEQLARSQTAWSRASAKARSVPVDSEPVASSLLVASDVRLVKGARIGLTAHHAALRVEPMATGFVVERFKRVVGEGLLEHRGGGGGGGVGDLAQVGCRHREFPCGVERCDEVVAQLGRVLRGGGKGRTYGRTHHGLRSARAVRRTQRQRTRA